MLLYVTAVKLPVANAEELSRMADPYVPFWSEWLENGKCWTKSKNSLGTVKTIMITFHLVFTAQRKCWPSRTIDAIVKSCFHVPSWNVRGEISVWETEIKCKVVFESNRNTTRLYNLNIQSALHGKYWNSWWLILQTGHTVYVLHILNKIST